MTAETEQTQGQVDNPEPSTGTTGPAPEGGVGKSASEGQTTASGTDREESFFDPKSIEGKPELEAAYKQMQRAFSKKTAEVAKSRSKLEQYDEFMRSPLDSMKALAQQLGYQLVQGNPDQNGQDKKSFETWDDVMAEAEKRVMDKMNPVFDELRDLKKHNVETYLDSNYPDWRTYEDEMLGNLQAHPSLVKDPDKLYRVSVPSEVLEARAIKAAKQKLEGSNQQIDGQGSTAKPTDDKPKGALSFDQAVQFARQKLASEGLRPPRE